ncbi:MAG TPA: putative selenate reductase subunit YgfK [Bacteroidales bacterium]|nr:putative selenate reductase subunit YgfK [Bacteroidales bacterium]
MSDKFAPLHVKQLFNLLFSDNSGASILGIPGQLFFSPTKYGNLKTELFNKFIASPFGVAAGPHSQLAQNIIAAWLCGARYIELKTVQTLDELKISKPCIDMQDEGYNCEWSQELKIGESFNEYLKAWIFIHLISHKLGYGNNPCTIFNLSVGYNYEGICNDNVQWFLNKMKDCSAEKEAMVAELAELYPEIKQIPIPSMISDNITLSTMHGCPPEEIEKIGRYLIEEKKLHTFIKLNPTLLGADELRRILNTDHHHKTTVPDQAFEHDLKYENAIAIIKSLSEAAQKNNVFFGIKLTNTLESLNHRNIFSAEEKMMYMSGKALHPISVNIARKLQNEFNGQLKISFSGGADCFNISKIIECGIYPVTVSSDLLKPGGYGRMNQYAQNISDFLHAKNIIRLSDHFKSSKGNENTGNLNKYADEVLKDKRYSKDIFSEPDIKTGRKLSFFDCIAAPCTYTCPTNQDIPDYLYHTATKEYDKALSVILKTNPLPAVCGMVCDHQCQSKCTRINYDDPLMIREIKRFITEQKLMANVESGIDNKLKAAIIGAGPSGLSCGFYLALGGFDVTIYETKSFAGGMVSDAIPQYRISQESINDDIERIKSVGVKIIYDSKINKNAFEQLRQQNDFIFIAVGAQKAKPFNIEGAETNALVDPLEFLSAIKKGIHLISGKKVAVVGGGNTAIDVARTAKRMAGPDGKICILYRRTLQDMPADAEEIKAALDENIEIIEHILPEKILSENNKMTGLLCSRMKPGLPDSSGRAAPVKIEGSEFTMEFDTIIPALGQDIVMDFVEEPVRRLSENSFRTQFPNVFIGGDALRGAATVIKAIADGRKAATEILNNMPYKFAPGNKNAKRHSFGELMLQRSLRQYRQAIAPHAEPKVLSLTECDSTGLTETEALAEAARCLHCDELCNICVTVCPNRANFSYEVQEQKLLLQKAVLKDNKEIVFEDDGELNIHQQYQVMNIADMCNECGNCTTFCPTSGRPFADKPRLFMDISKFKESEDGFFLKVFPDKINLVKKSNSEIKTLTFANEKYVFETDQVQAYFIAQDFELIHVKFLDHSLTEFNFMEAAEMYVLLNAMKNFSFLQ